ncbi:enterochelin esterase-like enzyme [Nakamurella sp. UYEF19]|uniref:alpha/beta hydrolase n=1 Tax=Nakamurella sp. UYEF19 TaxID=1756392 RepID=UPI00339361CC
MSLTGSTFVWFLGIAALAMFVWSIIVWPKSAGRGWWPVTRRVLHQLGILVLVLAFFGASLNSQYGWYSDWSDLASSFSNAQPVDAVQVAGAAPSQAAAGRLDGVTPGSLVTGGRRVGTAASLGLSAIPGPNGQYRTFQVPGPISGHSGDVTIWFPADYGSTAQLEHRFPVIEAFHGVPGSPKQLSGAFVSIGTVVAGLVAQHSMRDTVVVLPDYSPKQVDTECVNGSGTNPRMEDWLTKDVPRWVDTHVRVDQDRGSWATLGFSAGGWCAAMASMLHPETYSAGIVLQGYFQPTFEAPYLPFAANSAEASHYDLVRLAKQAPPRTALWILTSKQDPVSFGTTNELLKSAKPPLSITADVLQTGGHRTSVWTPLLPKSLVWLGANVPGFAPIT